MRIPCRGCGTLLDLSDTGCPICLRGRTPQEIANDARRLREEERRRRLLPWKILIFLTLLGAGGWLAARYREPLTRLYASVSGAISGALDKMRDPSYYAKSDDEQAPPPPPDPAATQAAPGTSAPRAAPAAPPAAPPPNPHQAAPAPPEPPREPTWELPPVSGAGMHGHWLVRGFVYDLASARPLADAELLFEAVEGEPHRTVTQTDRDGYYLVRLPRQRNYRAMARAKGYRTFPLEDGDPPYRTMSAAARRQALKEALDYSSDAATLGWNENYDEIRQDFALIPGPRAAR